MTISGTEVSVIGETGLIEATWKLVIGGEVVDSSKVTGDHVLRGDLPAGGVVEAHVHQGAFGPTKVEVTHDREHVATFSGFVL